MTSETTIRDPKAVPFARALAGATAASIVSWSFLGFQATIVDAAAAVAGAIGVLAAVMMLALGDRRALAPRLAAAWTAFMAVELVSGVLSQRGWSSFMGEPTNLLGWGVLAALTAIAAGAARLGGPLRDVLARYAWVVLLAETVLALAGLLSRSAVVGTLPNSTYFGMVVLLLLPWTVMSGDPRAERQLPLRAGTAALAIVALGAHGSRVAAVAALIWAAWTLVRRPGMATGAKVAVGAALAAVAGLAAFVFVRTEVFQTLTPAVLGDRLALWRMGAHALRARPLLGWGADGFLDGGSAVSTPELARSVQLLVLQPNAADPHSLLVWLAVSAGALGLAAFAWTAVEVALAWRRGGRDGESVGPEAWAVAMCLAMYLTAPAALQTLPLFALVLGVSVRGALGPAATAARALRPAVAGVLLAAAALFALNAAWRMPYERPSPEGSPALAPRAQAASDLWRFDPYLAYLASMHWGYATLQDPALAARRPDLFTADRAMKLDKRNPYYATVPARVYAFYGASPEQVAAAFEEAIERYPVNPFAQAPYAQMLAQEGKVDEAAEHLALAELATDEGNAERLALLQAARDEIAKARQRTGSGE